MIRVSFERDNGRLRIRADGHAGYAPHGEDIICAGVSTLLYTCIYYLLEKCGNMLEWDEDEGYLEMRFPEKDGKAAFDVTLAGIRMMNESHPAYVKLEYIRRDEMKENGRNKCN